MALRLGLKEFLSVSIKTITMYIWSLAMKRNFSKQFDIIAKKIDVRLLSCKIVDQLPYVKNDHVLLEKSNKPIFHKNLFNFFVQFLGMTFENTLLMDNMFHKSLVDPPFRAIFFRRSMGHIMMLITCSKSFFFIWNFCIHPKCEFINL